MTQTQPLLDTIVSPETQAKFTDAVASLAQSLGVAASHVYEVLVRQAYAVGVRDVIYGVLLLLAASFCAFAAWRCTKAYRKDDDDTLALIVSIVASLAIIPCCIEGVSHIGSSVLRISNPEYYAIQEVLSLLR